MSVRILTDGGGAGDVAQCHSRIVHGYLHALAGGDGAGLVVFAHRGRCNHAVGGVFSGIDGNATGRLLGVPYVGDIPFGASGSADGKLGFTTVADGAGAGDFIQYNGRSVHVHGETLGVGGGAVADGSCYLHSINGGVAGVDSDACVIAVVDRSIACTPCVGEVAVGAVRNGSDGEGGFAACTDGAGTGDVAESDRRSDDGQGHAHDTIATIGGGVLHLFCTGLCENGVSMLFVKTVGQLVVAASHLDLVGDGRCLTDGNGRRTDAAHVVGHRHGVLASGKTGDVGDILARLLVAPFIYIWCSLHTRRDLAGGGYTSVVATVAGHMCGRSRKADDIVLLRVGNDDAGGSETTTTIGIGY